MVSLDEILVKEGFEENIKLDLFLWNHALILANKMNKLKTDMGLQVLKPVSATELLNSFIEC